MRNILYIDGDEEMISVIGRIRRSTAAENVIVAPNRAILLQSVVNLRLLAHDARKNGREITVVTQDSQGRALCEKAGIRTQAALDEEDTRNLSGSEFLERDSSRNESSSFSAENVSPPHHEPAPSSEAPAISVTLPRSDAIGSPEFFSYSEKTDSRSDERQRLAGSPVSFVSPTDPVREYASVATIPGSRTESFVPPSSDGIQKISVRDQNPKKLTMLNSARVEEEDRARLQASSTPPSLRGQGSTRPVFAPVAKMPPVARVFRDANASHTQAPPQSTEQRPVHPLWFRANGVQNSPMAAASDSTRTFKPEKPVIVGGSGKLKIFFIAFTFVSLVSLIGVGAFVFLPKAEVSVRLKTLAQKNDFDFDGSIETKSVSAETMSLPVRLIEKDQDIALSFEATGETSLSDKKARGSVIISNRYGKEPQFLVASTRLLSKEGLVFRLVSGVTVPGMTVSDKGNEPGVVEAAVLADQPGSEYNIGPSEFSIPGFSGSPKHNAFGAASSDAMVGGGLSGSGVKAVSEEDVARAKRKAETQFREISLAGVRENLRESETLLDSAMEAAIVSSSISPQVGSVADAFEYRFRVHIRALVFAENDLRSMIAEIFSKQSAEKSVSIAPGDIELQYGEPTANFSSGSLRVKAHAIGTANFSLDATRFKDDVLGKDEAGLNDLLKQYPEIETLSVKLWPEIVTKAIPDRADRVTVTVDSKNP